MIYDLAILGGGPAGQTAGLYAARQGLPAILITKNLGGQMAQKAVEIENYPGFLKISGLELIQKFEEQLKSVGVPTINEKAIEIIKKNEIFKIVLESGEVIESRSVIIALGAEPRHLNVSGEKELLGRGVSYCVTCDGPLFAGKDIAIIGGGNAGFEAAIFMQTYASKIYILEAGEKVKADEDNQKKVSLSSKIEIITSAELKLIRGENFVQDLVYIDKKTNQEKTLTIAGVFVQIGYAPNSELIKDWVDLNEKQEIIIDPKTMQTKTAGLFAAGDITDEPVKQIIVAAGAGAKAALSAYNYIQKTNEQFFN